MMKKALILCALVAASTSYAGYASYAENLTISEEGGRPVELVGYNLNNQYLTIKFQATGKMNVCMNKGKNTPFVRYDDGKKYYIKNLNNISFCPRKTAVQAGYTFSADFPAPSYQAKLFSFIEGDCGSRNVTGCWRFRDISLNKKTTTAKVSKKDFYYIDNNKLTKSDLSKYTKEQLRLLRNYYFAKKGFPFKVGSDLETFFKQFSWYSPKEIESAYIFDNLLSEQEKNNVTLILAAERGQSVAEVESDLKKKYSESKNNSKNIWANTQKLIFLSKKLPFYKINKNTKTFLDLKSKNEDIKINKVKVTKGGVYFYMKSRIETKISLALREICIMRDFRPCPVLFSVSSDNYNNESIINKLVKNNPLTPSDDSRFIKGINKTKYQVDINRYNKLYSDAKKGIFIISNYRKGDNIPTSIQVEKNENIIMFFKGDYLNSKNIKFRGWYRKYNDDATYVHNINLTQFTQEEISHKNSVLKALRANKTVIDSLSTKEKQVLIKYYGQGKLLNEAYELLTNSITNSLTKQSDELELARATNSFSQGSSAQKKSMQSLIKLLRTKKDVDLYWEVLNIIDSSIDGVTEIANNLAKETWEQLIEPSDDLDATIKFINEFNGASGDIMSSAYEKAVQLGEKQLNDTYQKMVEQNPETSKLQIAERLARRYYKQAIRAKDSSDEITFAVKYEIVTTAPILEETEAGFNLYRDSEMKKFLQEHFDKLIKQNRQASADLIEQFSALGEKLDDLSSSMESSGEVDLEEERKANYRFLVQGYYFDKAMNGDK